MIDLKKFFRESLLLRFYVGVFLILLGAPWYWNPFAVFITLLGAAILVFVRAETFKKANENLHQSNKSSSKPE